MNKALSQATDRQAEQRPSRKLDWRKRMSDHVAFALLVYTGLQIFVTMTVLKSGHGSILPYFALVILVAAIIPMCRMIESRWDCLSDEQAADPELTGSFRHDCTGLWIFMIGLPFLLTAGVRGLEKLF